MKARTAVYKSGDAFGVREFGNPNGVIYDDMSLETARRIVQIYNSMSDKEYSDTDWDKTADYLRAEFLWDKQMTAEIREFRE